MKKRLLLAMMAGLFCLMGIAQVTSSSITGSVSSDAKVALEGATVTAVHVPSGTRYVTQSGKSGQFTFPNVRVGGPYQITITFTGYQEKVEKEVFASLGNTANVDVVLMSNESSLQTATVVATRNPILNSKATGASATFGREALNRAPTIGRTVNDITKYNAFSNGRSFGGQDSRFNNFTVDGAVFNNGFGLGNQAQAGGRTGSGAISLDALEEIQINIAPYDIRQSGFAGAAINAVTRSGTNEFAGSVFRFWNSRDLAGTEAGKNSVPNTPFNVETNGFRVGGPIIKDKLFFFVNGEFTKGTRPALDWVANRSGAVGNVSRTTAADLEDLSAFMKTNFNYDLGALDNFNNESSSNKFLGRIDWNINDKHKLSLRYSHHDSESDVIVSNSNSGNTAGNGNRQNLALALSGQNTGYGIMDNTRSYVAELNSTIKKNVSNQFLVTYNKQIEDRSYKTDGLFPTIDILKDGSTYTSLGMDPFTPNNRLNYATFNITNNTTIIKGKHTLTAGLAFEAFKSDNLFFYASNGVWTFNSIDDFKTAALAYKANPNLTVSPVPINRFNYGYTLLTDGKLPWQTFKTQTYSAYGQDEYKVNKKLRLTLGVRFDYLNITNTAADYYNPVVGGLTFKTPDGKDYKVNTGEMPAGRLYVSPRLGFNWDVTGKRTTQVRGGTGIFLSRMPYVLISNQLGNNGVNIGRMNVTGTAATNFPFTLDPTRYTPTTTDISKLPPYNVNYTDPNLKFPQVWRTNLAIDQKLPFAGIVATVEAIFNKNINALHYIDVNMKQSSGTFTAGPDKRAIFPALDLTSGTAAARFFNPQIANVFVLTNNREGYSYSLTGKLEKPITKNWGGLLGYTLAKATDQSSVASTVNANTPTIFGLNNLQSGYSDNDLRHRFVGNLSYRLYYGKGIAGATTFTLGMVSSSGFKISYTSSNDMNGDGQINDLIFVPNSAQEITFQTFTSGTGANAVTFTAENQQFAFDNYIRKHPYLSEKRGGYAERNGAEIPWLTRFDFAVEQDLILNLGKNKKANTFRFRMDILNAGNLINNDWGVGNVSTTTQPLNYRGRTAAGAPIYRLATQVVNGQTVLLQDAFVKSRTIDDVYQIQLGIRYIFNN
jgi:outer membrane receptor protein involved in Fe transport